MHETVLITGAASGLGKATALLFASKGWRVLATDMHADVPAEMTNIQNLKYLRMDVTDPKSIQAVFAETQNIQIEPKVIINCAGIYQMYPIAESDPIEIGKLFDINTFGQLNVIRKWLPVLACRGGRVVNISSESIRIPWLFQPYQLSKIAMEAISRALRQELRLLGVKLVIVRPGAIDTPLLKWMEESHELPDNSYFKKEFWSFTEKAGKKVGRTSDARSVAEVVYRAATAKHPGYYYSINNKLSLRIARVLPEWVQDWVVKKLVG